MGVSTLADDEQEQNNTGRYEALADALHELVGGDVNAVSVDEVRSPPRVTVSLNTANMTPAVLDRLDEFDAAVVPESVEVNAEGCLSFDLVTPEGFKPAGTREARRYGESSVSFTFTRESLELSGFEVGENLDVKARDGAILLTGHGQ